MITADFVMYPPLHLLHPLLHLHHPPHLLHPVQLSTHNLIRTSCTFPPLLLTNYSYHIARSWQLKMPPNGVHTKLCLQNFHLRFVTQRSLQISFSDIISETGVPFKHESITCNGSNLPTMTWKKSQQKTFFFLKKLMWCFISYK